VLSLVNVMAKHDQLSPQEKIDRAIQRAWIAALVCGGITLVVGLIAIGGTQLVPGYNGGIVLDALILFGLAFGVYKRSRICATLLVGYAAFNEVYIIITGIDKSPGLRVIFIYFYFRGMLATFAYQKQCAKPSISVTADVTQSTGSGSPSSLSIPRFAIQPQKSATEEPIIPANSRISRKSVLVSTGVLAFIAISIATWHLAATSRHQTSLQKTRSSVVLIEVFDAENEAIATGSGFFVSADGILVTNFHVIERANRIVVKLESGAMYEVSGVLADDSKSDVVLLRVKANGFPFLKLGDSVKAEVGQHVMVIGSPLGLEGTVSDGIISAKRELPGKEKWLQITAPIAPGSSGSPVLDANNEVLGVATMLIREGQALNFAVPIELAKALLAEIKPDTVARPLEKLTRQAENDIIGDAEYGEFLGAMASEDYVQALNLVKSLEKRFPANVEECDELRAVYFHELKLYQDAIVACQKALKLRAGAASDAGLMPEANIWFVLADSYKEQGETAEAIVAYKRGLAINPDNATAWNSLGNVYDELGKPDQALAAYQQAVKIKPDHHSP
jgi:S1-C subfamily serine protease